MGLTQALATAMSGLRANQAALTLVSSNVANVETPGYVRKSVNQVQTTTGTGSAGVTVTGVNRELDVYVQKQVLTETSGASYASTLANALQRLQGIYGDPSSDTTLEAAFNQLTAALQALSTTSDSPAARTTAVNAAQSLAQMLNSASAGIQSLRADAESSIKSSVDAANNAMKQIATINNQLLGTTGDDAAAASLLDQRDQYVAQLSQLMDIRVITNDRNQVTVFTNSGVQLVGSEAATISFDAQGTVTPNTTWSSDPSKSTLGTLTLTFPHGGDIDLIATNSIRSGSIAANLQLRDQTLVQAQAQIDQLAASMASALSDKVTSGTKADGPPANFSLDLTGLQNGNNVQFTYTDSANKTHTVTLVQVNDPSVLPLKNSATNDPNDEVFGVDFSQGVGAVISQLNGMFGGAGLQFSNPTGETLQISGDAGGNAVVNSATSTITMTNLTSGNPELPLFVDNGVPYTGAITATGSQQTGLAGRISVNNLLLADPSRMIIYGAGTQSGDTTRSDFILSKLTQSSYYVSPQTGIGSSSTPFKGTMLSFLQQFTTMQGQAAASAQQLADGQNVVLSTLQNKLNSSSGVNIDEEMAHLLALQNAYSANARVMSTVKDMFDSLLQSM
ncbi:MAG: flagellar hook-associated protein FlgK [Afipia felis]|nr:flagellar hook-associated protein FlgK [Afipia felis]